MANKYKLEGESRGTSLGGLFRAIGWFILIVLGIVVALNAYYWNESKEAEQKKLQTMSAIEQEASDNAQVLQKHSQKLESQIEQLNLLLASANRTVDADSLLMSFYLLFEQSSVRLNKGVYRFLSDDVTNMLSYSFKNSLVQFYETDIHHLQTQEKAIKTYIDGQLTNFLIDERNLSLVNPTLKTDLIQISADQRNRIIRILLNNRRFIDLVYYRISQLTDLMTLERTLTAHATLLKEEATMSIEQMNSEK